MAAEMSKRCAETDNLVLCCSVINNNNDTLLSNRLIRVPSSSTWSDVITELDVALNFELESCKVKVASKLHGSDVFHPNLNEPISIVQEFDSTLKYATFEHSIRYLAKKKNTLKAFQDDLKWAKDGHLREEREENERENHGGNESSMDDGFVRESHEEIVEDSVHDDDSVNDPNYVQESESDGVIEWTAENIHKVVKETEDTLDHGECDCNNEEVQEAGNRTIERENTIADVTDDALDDLPCTRGLKNSDCVFDGHLREEREENERENHGGDESSMDDGFVRESHEEIVEDSVHDDDSVNDPNYVQESESDGVIEWTAENIHKLYKVVKETEDALDHGESDCNNEEVQEAGNRTIERENTIADVTDDALDDLPCTRGLKNSDCVFDGHLRKEREENERENHGGDESSMDDGFVRESHEEIVEDSVHDDDSVNDPNYVQESESDGCDEESFSSEGDDMSEVIEWTAENIHKVVKETEDTLDHGESDCNNEEVQEAGNRTIERENTIADVTDDALEDLPCTRGLKDSDCVFDDKYENVFIKGFRKENAKSKHNRVYDCVHACVFCFKLFTNIQCHLEHKHSNQAQMKVIREKKLAIEVSVEEMKKTLNGDLKAKLNLLRNKGDNLHNLKVLKHKQGELLVKRRTTNNEKFSLDDYGPCPNCEEWFLLRMSLTNHQKVCPAKKEEEFHKGTTMIQIAVLTGRLTQTGSKILKSEVFPGMKKDQIGITAIEDSLITALGDCWLMKNIDNKRKRRHYASFHMRLAARLLSAFRNMTGERTTTVDKMLIPDNFDQITECALQICNTNNDSDEYDAYQLEHPSTAIKAGFDIMRLASAKLGLAIKVGNAIARQEATDFINLMKLEWNVRVTKLATSLLSERRFNTKKELPHPVDIMKFATFLVDELKALDLNISDGEKFQTTAALVQTRLLLYNRRRPGELEALSLEHYENRSTNVSETDMSLRHQLTDLEKKMLQNQEIIEIRGKNGTRVPVICPEEVMLPMKFLANKQARQTAGIKSENKYLFANTALDVIHAGTSMEALRSKCNLQFPSRMHATNLRKHCATIAQVIGLKDHELKYLCKHMGHTLRVHETHYRSTSGLIERLDIAKLMLIQEANLVGKFTGKSLNDITFEEIIENEAGNDDAESPSIDNTESPSIDNAESPSFDNPSTSFNTGMTTGMTEDDLAMDNGEDFLCTRKKPKTGTRITWSEQEMGELRMYFPEYFNRKTKRLCPTRQECFRAITLSEENKGVLFKRNWATIKKKVYNHLLKH